MLTFVTFDPGVTTGIVDGWVKEGLMSFRSKQEQWSVYEVWEYLNSFEPKAVIYEEFHYRNRARRGLELFPVQLIGVFNLYCQSHANVAMYPQPPGTGFERYSDAELKRLEVHKKGRPHAMDALRHTLYWWNHGAGYRYNTAGIKELGAS